MHFFLCFFLPPFVTFDASLRTLETASTTMINSQLAGLYTGLMRLFF